MATSKKTIVASPKKRAAVKRVAKVADSEKVTPKPKKKITKKSVAAATVPDSETVIAPPLKVKKPVKEEVQLPTNASLRSKEKAYALADIIEHLEKPFFVIAYVSAACFFAVGLSLLVSGHLKYSDSQLAQLLTSTSTFNGSSGDGGDVTDPNQDPSTSGAGSSGGTIRNTTQTITLTPEFELLEPLPSVIENDLRITMYVANASNVQVKAYSKTSTKSYDFPAERVSNTNWRFTIPAKILPEGEYSIRLQATTENGSGVYTFTVGSFTRPQQEEAATQTTNTTSSTGSSNTAASTSTDSSEETVTTDAVDEETTATTTPYMPLPTTQTTFEIVNPGSVLSDYEAIRIYAPEDYSKIEVYVRPSLSTQSIFVGSAFKNDNRWSLAFNTNNVPNGKYQMFAVATYQAQRVNSKSITVSVYNKVEFVAIEESVVEEINDEQNVPTDTDSDESEVDNYSSIERSFYSYENDTAFVPVGEESKEVETETMEILTEEKETINDLLKNYAIAAQSDNDLLNHTLNQDFDAVRREILKKILEDGENSELAEQIDEALKARLDELKERVDSFEELRTSRTSSDIGYDSDNDGISVFDEKEDYDTDPLNPDTDNDGFLDGVEVVRGFNPTDSASEAVVEFELPQTTVGLARNDILVVHQVRPLIENDETLETPKVQTEITGKGLPNSFVTLYIFSTPTIVTIKTDADGSFTYTFDKELEDGEHEVYVAFTDNTGSIMAHSEPFRFVKEAEAFTQVGAENEGLVTAPSIIENSRAQQTNTVIGLGILAFGIILLMLGMSIRPKKTELEESTV